MSKKEPPYSISGLNVSDVRNRNEVRVAKALRKALKHLDSPLAPTTIMDIYALALNELPARYTQTGTIVLGDPIKEKTIESTVQEAIERVLAYPKS